MYLVVDLEATCWETKEEQGNKPNEIIEIGIVKLDEDFNVVKAEGYVVKPRFTKITPFCTKLTGWTQEDIEAQGKDIAEVLNLVEEEFGVSDVNAWFSWGQYDFNKLHADRFTPPKRGSLTEIYKIYWSPFAKVRHVNAKEAYANKFKVKPMGMDRALAHAKLPLEGRHHNGKDDALNIAKLVKKLY